MTEPWVTPDIIHAKLEISLALFFSSCYLNEIQKILARFRQNQNIWVWYNIAVKRFGKIKQYNICSLFFIHGFYYVICYI